ncbi:hypothetical protein HFP57_12700 [Parasphingopyxis algicola]|uniref:hypothetical protein n=1 Tax=Parasphingopyxis algicola TaxID=2026624 RepID=UPI0015A27FAC|nr:hypothetical protein [Parasphingopyxis algicola]QLC25792.1 hypothetical protein HFP57_12700 [Parasphingopyxis algicola]
MANRLSPLKRLRGSRVRFLAAVFLVAQALVPNGFMPVFGADGPRIMLCTGQGLQRASLPDNAPAAMLALADAMDDEPAPESDNTPCDYAAAPNSIAKTSAIAIAKIPPPSGATSFPPAGLVAIGAGLAAPPPPQTGPPLTF